jgi:bifunctional non-homologous end joining protein LigD
VARSTARDTSIRTYRAKRDFSVTREPAANEAHRQNGEPIFVVQKHQAHRAGLHYDFRLQRGSVLWSWAVRKGLSLDPKDRHVAVHVEDHPLDYAVFTGNIPDGQYGAGNVEIWDHGTWEPLNDPDEGMRKGELTFALHGQRLNGRFHLVRLRPKPGQPERQDNWLLFKGHDEAEHAGADATTIKHETDRPGSPRRKAASKNPPKRRAVAARIATARDPIAHSVEIAGVTMTHPDRELWPGITKRDLAEYWVTVANHALPGLAKRPLAIVRCPDGIGGEHFFQKNGRGTLPDGIREGRIATSPYLAIDGLHGLVGMAQVSAIELHPWGAAEGDPDHPDTLVFDLDPGEGVPFAHVVRAAHNVRDRLRQLNMTSFCRTTGGKGLHVVVPIAPKADWEAVRLFCRGFAEILSAENPTRFLSTVKKADRRGRILLDWLRNALGATAVASFCPRARPGATVATPLAWDEVTEKLDPAMFTLRSVPERLGTLSSDPWIGFRRLPQLLPDLARESTPLRPAVRRRAGKAAAVGAAPPKRHA